MKTLLADYDMDGQHLVYSTAELMTHAALTAPDVAVLQGRTGEDGGDRAALRDQPDGDRAVGRRHHEQLGRRQRATCGSTIRSTASPRCKIGGAHPLLLLIADDDAAATLWRDDTAAGPVIVRGPELVRTAEQSGGTLDLTGDTTTAADLEVWAPAASTASPGTARRWPPARRRRAAWPRRRSWPARRR